ncbi:30S ribosomal protein S18 [Anaplasmataceae bacterium AB001_6]|nr:30S ribosomal protein S18 [Anaplasmataceae bacterium AB001_6]
MRRKFTKPSGENRTARFSPQKKQKVCPLKDVVNEDIKFNNITQLSEFVSEGGRVLPRRATGLCCKHQRKVRAVVKIARFLALIPFCANHK